MLNFLKWSWDTFLEIVSMTIVVLISPVLAAILFAVAMLVVAVALLAIGIAVAFVVAAVALIIAICAILTALAPAITLVWAINQVMHKHKRSKTHANGHGEEILSE